MAAYSKTSALKGNMAKRLETWNSLTYKIIMDKLLTLINTEFAAMETAGLAGYTVTSGLANTMIQELQLLEECEVQILEDFIRALVVEFGLVETNGLSYTKTTTFTTLRKRDLENLPNVEHRISLFEILDIIDDELDLLEAAS